MESCPVIDAVGIWFYSVKTNRYLYLMRNDPKNPNTWGLAGGKCDPGESLMTTIYRECQEELGKMPEYTKLVPIEKFTSPDGQFGYHTFFCMIEDEFTPVLNDEHYGYAWLDSGHWPKPMHPGLWATVNFEEVQKKIEIVKNQTSQLLINVW